MMANFDDIVMPEGRVHFAGDHCSKFETRWIQGAIESGFNVVRSVHEARSAGEPVIWDTPIATLRSQLYSNLAHSISSVISPNHPIAIASFSRHIRDDDNRHLFGANICTHLS